MTEGLSYKKQYIYLEMSFSSSYLLLEDDLASYIQYLHIILGAKNTSKNVSCNFNPPSNR